MDERTHEQGPEDREETLKDIDLPEGDADDVKGGIGPIQGTSDDEKHGGR